MKQNVIIIMLRGKRCTYFIGILYENWVLDYKIDQPRNKFSESTVIKKFCCVLSCSLIMISIKELSFEMSTLPVRVSPDVVKFCLEPPSSSSSSMLRSFKMFLLRV